VLFLVLVGLREISLSRFWRWGPLLLLVVLVAMLAVSAWGMDPFAYIAERGRAYVEPSADPTSSGRLTHWKYELIEARRSLLAGQGFGGYFSVYIPEYGYKINVAPHNFYVFTLVKQGLIGLLLYAACALAVAVLLWRRMRSCAESLPSVSRFLVMFGFAALLVASAYYMVYARDWYTMLWVGLGLAASQTGAAFWPGSDKHRVHSQ
jgi:O-antigen ligase